MLVVTTDNLPGYEIREVLGEVIGVTARTHNPFAEGIKSLHGATNPRMIEVLTRWREEAVERMAQIALKRGANAVVGMRFDHREITSAWVEICAYGTAAVVALTVTSRSAEQGGGGRATDHAGAPPARPHHVAGEPRTVGASSGTPNTVGGHHSVGQPARAPANAGPGHAATAGPVPAAHGQAGPAHGGPTGIVEPGANRGPIERRAGAEGRIAGPGGDDDTPSTDREPAEGRHAVERRAATDHEADAGRRGGAGERAAPAEEAPPAEKRRRGRHAR